MIGTPADVRGALQSCIVVIIGVCLCLIELRYLSGRNGVRSINAKHMQAVVDLWIKHCQRQIEMLNQQSRQLADLGQKMTTQSADTVAQNWNRAADTAGRNQSAF